MNKIVYSYDDKNYFTERLLLDDSDRSPSGRWNVPARTTEIEPPAKKDGYKIKWNGESWEYEEEEKEKPQPEPTFEELKEQKKAEIDAWTRGKITGGFQTDASGEMVTYDSDVDTQITMSRVRANCESDRFAVLYPQGAPVRGYAQGAEEKTIFMLNAEQIIKWDQDLGIHIATWKQAGWEKKAQAEKATTKEELDAIVLD